MEYNFSHGGIKTPNTQFINNNNYLTFLLADNLKSIKINYSIKGQDSFNYSVFSGNKNILNRNSINNFKNFMNNFDKFNSISPQKHINYKLGQVKNFSNRIYNRNELRKTKDSFFGKKDISNSIKNEEKQLIRNKSAKNIKRSELNLFNRNYKNNMAKDNKQDFVNSYHKNNNNLNKFSINDKLNNNYNQNNNQFMNYSNNTKKIKGNNSKDKNSQKKSFNNSNNSHLILSLNPLYISSRRKIGDNKSSNNRINLYLKKNNFKFNINNNKGKNSDSRRSKKIMQLKNPQNNKPLFKDYKTPMYKIKKNILKVKELFLNKKIKLSSVSTRGQKTKDNKSKSEMNYTWNEKDFKRKKDISEIKEIKEIIKGCIGVTQAGQDFNFNRKINQDYYVIETNINGMKNFNIFCVLDGHGLYGHLISLFVGKYMRSSFINNDEIKSCSDLEEIYLKLKNNNFSIINEIFVNAEKELYTQEFDSNFSGTTCIIVIQLGEKIICANTGDSRAILIYNEKEIKETVDKNNKTNKIKRNESNFYQIKNIIAPFSTYRNNLKNSLRGSSSVFSLDFKKFKKLSPISNFNENSRFNFIPTKIFNLSNDLKPTLPLEKKRIIENGGRVEQFLEKDGNKKGPYRVWVQDEMYPGLAMSRSIGDFIASSVGVIPNPEIIEYNINKSSKYMIIATDGIWQFMSNEKVMNIANQFYPKRDPIDLCNELIKEANISWENEGLPRDDITVLVVYF